MPLWVVDGIPFRELSQEQKARYLEERVVLGDVRVTGRVTAMVEFSEPGLQKAVREALQEAIEVNARLNPKTLHTALVGSGLAPERVSEIIDTVELSSNISWD